MWRLADEQEPAVWAVSDAWTGPAGCAMSPDDLLTLENVASMSRRDLLKLAGVAGIAGGGMSTADMFAASSSQAETDAGWTSMLDEIHDIAPGANREFKLKTSHSLQLLSVSEDPVGDPVSTSDIDGNVWQFTFMLQGSGIALERTSNGDTTIAGRKVFSGFENSGPTQFSETGFSIFPKNLKGGDPVAISARRDKDLLGFIDGKSLSPKMHVEINANDWGDILALDPDEHFGNFARMRRRVNQHEEFQHDFNAILTSLALIGLGLTPLSGPMAGVGVGFRALSSVGSLILPWLMDDVPDKPLHENQGVNLILSTPSGPSVAGHSVMFDVYVSPSLGTPGGEKSSTTVRVTSELENIGEPSTDTNRGWDLKFERDSSGVITVTPTGIIPPPNSGHSLDIASQKPKPSIDPPPNDPATDKPDGVKFAQSDSRAQAFDASESIYGSAPIETYEWIITRPDGSTETKSGSASSDAQPEVSPEVTFDTFGTYSVELTLTDTQEQTATLVEEYPVSQDGTQPAAFDVSLDGVPNEITAGTDLAVQASIENVGNEAGSTKVALFDSDGSKLASDSVSSVAAGETSRVTLPVPSSKTASPTTLDLTVEAGDAKASTTVSVAASEEGMFLVAIPRTNGPVTVGEKVTVDAEITNTGDTAGSPTASLSMGGTTYDSTQPPTISPGTSTTVTLSVPGGTTTSAGTKDLTVDAGGASAQTIVQIEPRADSNSPVFELEFRKTIDTVTVGETATLQVKVNNTGESVGTQDVDLRDADSGELITSKTVENLALVGSELLSFTVPSSRTSTAGPLNLQIQSEDDTLPHTIDVVDSGGVQFEIQNVEAQGQALVDEPVDVEIRVNNTGQGGEGIVELVMDSSFMPEKWQFDATTVNLDSREETVVTLHPYDDTGSDSPGRLEYAVKTNADKVSRSLDIVESNPADFQVSIDSAPGQVVSGESIVFDVTVENTGGQTDTQPVRLRDRSEYETIDSTEMTLDGGQSQSVTLTVPGSEVESGELALGVDSWDTQVNHSVTVGEPRPPNFQVTNVSVPSDAATGEALDVTATVENTGTSSGTKEIRLLDDSETELDAISGTSIGGGASTNVTLAVPANRTSTAGTFQVRVETPDDSGTGAVQVGGGDNTPADFQVTNLDGPYYDGTKRDWLYQPSNFHVTVVNSGGTSDTQTIRLRKAGGTEYDSTSISLGGGERTTVTLTFPQSAAIPQSSFTMVAATEDDTQRLNVPVLNLDISLDIDI